jgi:hypothetical protein
VKTKTLPVASLVEDFAFYPRNRVDDAHVGDLVRALQSGATLPPVVVDAESLRIVDGVHRSRAHRRHFGEDAKVAVELRKYTDDRALFLDAVALNSAHGRKLDRHDQTRIVLRLRELGATDELIALRLHVPEPQVTQLAIRVVMAPDGPVPSKRGLEHLRGQTFTSEQVAVMGSVRSAEAGRLALELIRLLNADLVDLDDDVVVSRLRELHDVISERVQRVAVPA